MVALTTASMNTTVARLQQLLVRLLLVVAVAVTTWFPQPVHAQAVASSSSCLADKGLNDIFVDINGGVNIPKTGSCCMQDVCGLACPKELPEPAQGYGIAVTVSIVFSFVIGLSTYFFVKGQSVNFFVAGRSLPLWIVAMTLGAQSVDSNSLLGNVDLSYRYSFYDGAVIPIGLGLSLIINGIFLAHHVNDDEVLTLPDIFAKRYGRVVEVLVSCTSVASFLMLLAGNLVGFGVVCSYLWGIEESVAIWTAAAIIWAYTVTGGLFSVAYTDVAQGIMGWSGCLIMAFWFIHNEDVSAPPPSIGFPNYTYPDTFGDGGACDMYNGTKCFHSDACCYNTGLWCPEFSTSGNCDRYDRGAYPFGDLRVYPDQMTKPFALDPFPNAILWNWATIFILAIGNLGALDFQARCMASKTPTIARQGCIIGGLFTFVIGIPFSYLGAITRHYYGPDSVYGMFEADSCQAHLGLPTCALWVPDSLAFLKLLTFQAPPVLGAWCMIGIIAASMSTADGAILAMGTVMSHNVVRQLDTWFPNLVTPDNLLNVSRLTTIPFTLISTLIAAYYRSTSSTGGTGYLLIVAFDIMFATSVVPLFGCFYAWMPSPRAALLCILSGVICRITLEFVLPKDGYFILPFDDPAFFDVGPAASANYPAFMDVPQDMMWDTTAEPCKGRQFEDYTGIDSLASFLLSALIFVTIQWLENYLGRPIFEFGGSDGYIKDTTEHPLSGIRAGEIGKILEEVNKKHKDELDLSATMPHNQDHSVKFKEQNPKESSNETSNDTKEGVVEPPEAPLPAATKAGKEEEV